MSDCTTKAWVADIYVESPSDHQDCDEDVDKEEEEDSDFEDEMIAIRPADDEVEVINVSYSPVRQELVTTISSTPEDMQKELASKRKFYNSMGATLNTSARDN